MPVLDSEFPNAFDNKYDIICKDKEWQHAIDNLDKLSREGGFEFLNSTESIDAHEKIRTIEARILNSHHLLKQVESDIEAYEDSMFQNIVQHACENSFRSGIFMCGAGHRKAILEKINSNKVCNEGNFEWKFLNFNG